MVDNLQKRCNISGINFLPVQADYSSFIGNFLFRDLELPDMVLASIELGTQVSFTFIICCLRAAGASGPCCAGTVP